MSFDDVSSLADRLHGARGEGRILPALDIPHVPVDVAAAYRIQDRLISLHGRPVRAWKVGATSRAAQRALRLEEPFFGPVFDDVVFRSPVRIDTRRWRTQLLEPEIAVVLGADLPYHPGLSARQAAAAIAASFPAVELIDFRTENGRTLGPLWMITDFGANGGLVLGAETAAGLENYWDLPLDVRINGSSVARRTAPPPETEPAEVIAFLARHLSTRNLHLRKGDIVTTGSQGGLIPYSPGDTVEVDFGRAGGVSIRFD